MVTGGAGYVGSRLVPKLLDAGYEVVVFDLYLYGEQGLAPVRGNPNLTEIRGDLRDPAAVERAVAGADTVIHLACISNDPSFELDPDLGKSINYDCFPGLVRASKDAGVTRFVYASSSSVYGVKQEEHVTENLSLEPLTDYSKFKAMCEELLTDAREKGFETLILRPATVCGYAPRLRLDLSVNIMTNHAVNNRAIRVFGGSQVRPNIHIEDMTDLYVQTVSLPSELVDGKIYNAGYYNQTIGQIAETTRDVVGPDVTINVEPTNDLRSYRINSDLIKRELGFEAKRDIATAVRDLVSAFERGLIPDPMNDPRYFNIKTMQLAGLK
ncbi:MAG: NAD-dependent epimerase/dehydratase family protein [Candidatus Eremiobacteraeota bacterium]|nr:NAD-dependent epimerase/dehydratase family protein [Candidatus Eremiobacteraeota bacterium]